MKDELTICLNRYNRAMPTVEVARIPVPDRISSASSPLVVLGTSGHAREIAWIGEAAGHPLLGCLGPHRPADAARLPAPWLGEDDWLDTADPSVRFLIGLGDGSARARIDRLASRNGRRAGSLISPAATIGARCSLGAGSVLWPGAILTTDVRLGRHVHVGTGATVSHDTDVDDFATLLPGCRIAGSSRIGRGTTIGAGATVVDNISVGENTVVGAGAVVVHDVPENVVVVGVPARILRSNHPAVH
ncbi:NeuD/PglB/VioB family sugar acetyltransferase [Micromonospora profundi]|uniref:NeuD/PglB/VioB family sugar acetyltransferase n=2 Tax=Micromonospora profundi TaxID=1420889 RepID=A0AAJ6HQ69_9ACTN|nr:NeuD/PglB/VioB family sugar acetyltransferase [Micromonospora profundi]WLS45140.1 NeuD/PglB/VioB family sugar acetyltransferase [Micromonospora profundi]